MSTVVQCSFTQGITYSQDIGIGEESQALKNYSDKAMGQFREKTVTFWSLDELRQRLDEVLAECSSPGWDGYDAIPINIAAYYEAIKFIERIPFSIIPMPEIIPEPGGEIAFEWYKGKRQVFVASVSGKNEIIYAGLFGMNKTHGTEYFGDSLSPTIINNLIRLYY